MVFRQSPGPTDDHAPVRSPAPPVVGFGIDGDAYTVLCQRDGGVERWTFAAHGTDAQSTRLWIDGDFDETSRVVVTDRVWLLASSAGVLVGKPEPGGATVRLAPKEWGAAQQTSTFPLWIDGAIRVLRASGERGNGSAVSMFDVTSRQQTYGPVQASNTARALLAACATVHGAVAIYTTDRDDEVDLCALRKDGVEHKTLSLGGGQRFVCAAGGGSRIAIVSRRDNDVRVRTVASDLRSELNSVPLAAGTRSTLGAVRVVHAGGSTFVIAHKEAGETREVVVTVFDDGKTRTVRSKFPAMHGLALAGKHVAIAALIPGAATPILHVQQLTLVRDDARSESYASAPKRRAYLVGDPPSSTAAVRRAALEDAAQVLAHSLAAQPPRELQIGEIGGRERAVFVVPGVDVAKDLAVSMELREDGSGIVNVKLGAATAPAPRELTIIEKLRVLFTGDDDGDPDTSHFELASLSRDIGQVVMAVWALKLTRM